MSELPFSKKIRELPPEAKQQAQDFVDFLYQHYVSKEDKKASSAGKISESPFFGIWKKREEMRDSVEWVKKTRKSQWPNPIDTAVSKLK